MAADVEGATDVGTYCDNDTAAVTIGCGDREPCHAAKLAELERIRIGPPIMDYEVRKGSANLVRSRAIPQNTG